MTNNVTETKLERVELHAHTKMSGFDSVIDTKELIETALKMGHKAVAITDHGCVYALPEAAHILERLARKPEYKEVAEEFKIIYGCEGYLVNDDNLIDENGNPVISETEYTEEIKNRAYTHVTLLCRNETGRKNLYRLVSESYIKYFGKGRPRMPKSLLNKYREGLLLGSACDMGELFKALLCGKSREETERIAGFYDYLEIQPVENYAGAYIQNDAYSEIKTKEDLWKLNIAITEIAEKQNKLCIAASDAHFIEPADERYRKIARYISAVRRNAVADYKESDDALFFRTTDEMVQSLKEHMDEEKAFTIAVTNTIKISDMIEYISPVRKDRCHPVIENADAELRKICYKKAETIYGSPLPEKVSSRLDNELGMIAEHEYSYLYLINSRICKKAGDAGYHVGTRGSAGSSLAAYMAGITEINPLPPHYYCKACHYTDFNSEEVKAAEEKMLSGYDLPDAACPICGKKLKKDGHYIPFETFMGPDGAKSPDFVFNVADEYQAEAFKNLNEMFGEDRVYIPGTISTLSYNKALEYVKEYYEYKNIPISEEVADRAAEKLSGMKTALGRHPGRRVILPEGEEIYSFTPIQHADDGSEEAITHFRYYDIDHNLMTVDLLGHSDLSMIYHLEKLTGEKSEDWDITDDSVISLFRSCEALGVKASQIGTDLGTLGIPDYYDGYATVILKKVKPNNFSDIVKISGLAHGTDVWSDNGEVLIDNNETEFSSLIGLRDDIMLYLMQNGIEKEAAFRIMESVRKGRGLREDMEELMEAHNIPEWYIWSCKQIKYLFPKAHACNYTKNALVLAYCKLYHPLEFYTAFLTVHSDGFDYEIMAQGPEHLQGEIDKNEMLDNDFEIDNVGEYHEITSKLKIAKVVREMYARGFEFAPYDARLVDTEKFTIVSGRIMPPVKTVGKAN